MRIGCASGWASSLAGNQPLGQADSLRKRCASFGRFMRNGRRRRRLRLCGAVRPVDPGGSASRGSSGSTRSWSTPTNGCSPPSTAPHCSTASRDWPRPCTPRTPPTSRCCTAHPRGMEPERLRLPPHPAGAGHAPVVLTGGQRHRRLPRRRRSGTGHHPGDGRSRRVAPPPRAGAPAGALGGAVPPTGWGKADYEAWSDHLLAQQTGFVMHTTWEGEAVGRLALLHPDTGIDLIADLLASTA